MLSFIFISLYWALRGAEWKSLYVATAASLCSDVGSRIWFLLLSS